MDPSQTPSRAAQRVSSGGSWPAMADGGRLSAEGCAEEAGLVSARRCARAYKPLWTPVARGWLVLLCVTGVQLSRGSCSFADNSKLEIGMPLRSYGLEL